MRNANVVLEKLMNKWLHSKLLQRFLTAAVLITLVVWVICASSQLVYVLFFAAVILLGAWEWSVLMGLEKYSLRIVYLLFIALLMLMLVYTDINIFFVLTAALITWLISLYWVIRYPQNRNILDNKIVSGTLGVLVLVPCWFAISLLRTPHGASLVMFVLILVWSIDSGAYFAGRFFGKHKLAPQVSPGKTIEGLCGGLACAIIIGFIGVWWFALPLHKWPLWFVLILITTAASVLGDLLESMMKRHRGVKDCGNILPGHGGVLDRIDSLTAAVPIFVLSLLLFGV